MEDWKIKLLTQLEKIKSYTDLNDHPLFDPEWLKEVVYFASHIRHEPYCYFLDCDDPETITLYFHIGEEVAVSVSNNPIKEIFLMSHSEYDEVNCRYIDFDQYGTAQEAVEWINSFIAPEELNPHPGDTLFETFVMHCGTMDKLIYPDEGEDGLLLDTLLAICNGKASITEEIAEKLEKGIGIDATFWMKLQENYDKRHG